MTVNYDQCLARFLNTFHCDKQSACFIFHYIDEVSDKPTNGTSGTESAHGASKIGTSEIEAQESLTDFVRGSVFANVESPDFAPKGLDFDRRPSIHVRARTVNLRRKIYWGRIAFALGTLIVTFLSLSRLFLDSSKGSAKALSRFLRSTELAKTIEFLQITITILFIVYIIALIRASLVRGNRVTPFDQLEYADSEDRSEKPNVVSVEVVRETTTALEAARTSETMIVRAFERAFGHPMPEPTRDQIDYVLTMREVAADLQRLSRSSRKSIFNKESYLDDFRS